MAMVEVFICRRSCKTCKYTVKNPKISLKFSKAAQWGQIWAFFSANSGSQVYVWHPWFIVCVITDGSPVVNVDIVVLNKRNCNKKHYFYTFKKDCIINTFQKPFHYLITWISCLPMCHCYFTDWPRWLCYLLKTKCRKPFVIDSRLPQALEG